MTFLHHDDCCSKFLSVALLNGHLDGKASWDCPECSTEWRMQEREGGHEYWAPVTEILIIPPRS